MDRCSSKNYTVNWWVYEAPWSARKYEEHLANIMSFHTRFPLASTNLPSCSSLVIRFRLITEWQMHLMRRGMEPGNVLCKSLLEQEAPRVNSTQRDHCPGTTAYSFGPSGQHSSANRRQHYLPHWLFFNCFCFSTISAPHAHPPPQARCPAQPALTNWNQQWKEHW